MYIRLVPHYLYWHYTLGIRDYFRVAKNITRLIDKIFSFKFMMRTFFDPFERLGESYHKGSFADFFESLTVNMLMRMVGIVVRFCILIIGIFALLLTYIFLITGFVFWLILPALPLILLYISIFSLTRIL